MKHSRPRSNLLLFIFATLAILLFQNCGPARLQSEGSSDPNSSLLGSKVSLADLNQSAAEPAGNIIYPLEADPHAFEYTSNSPVFENVVLSKNDFQRIIWVHAPSETIVGVGDTFKQRGFTAELAGSYLVFGYRNEIPFKIAEFKLAERTTASSAVDSPKAVQVTTRFLSSDLTNESYLISIDARGVDLATIDFVLASRGSVIQGQRGMVITKTFAENLDVEVKLSDTVGKTFATIINLPSRDPADPTATKACTLVAESSVANLTCPTGQRIKSISFASFGNVIGMCGSLQAGTCHSATTVSIMSTLCVGKLSCSIPASTSIFGDPCSGTAKRLGVEVLCAP
jgi:hypothetical protein